MFHNLHLATPYGPANVTLPYIPQIGAKLTWRGTTCFVSEVHHDLDMNVTIVILERRP